MLTPMDIHDHQFKKAFRGYSENEVDDFLDRVVEDFEKLLRENERLKNQSYANERELEKYRNLEKTLNDTLMVAQRTADDVISSARRNADEIKESAARDCQQIRDQAQFEAKQIIEAAKVKRNRILDDYAKLVGEKNAFLLKMRTILESELAITNHVISVLPSFDEMEKMPEVNSEVKPVEVKPAEPAEEPKPSPPAETPKPEVKKSEVKKSTVKKTPVEVDEIADNIVDVSTKPVTDETRTYKPVNPASKPEEASK